MATDNTLTLIQAVTVGSGGAANIEFSSIPQTYTDLQIVLSGRDSGNGDWFSLNFNNSSANFSGRQIFANGSGVFSYTKTDANEQAVNNNNSTTSNTFGNTLIYICNYTRSNSKSYSIDSVIENNSSTSYQVLFAGQWSDNSAINNIKIIPSGSGFAQHSTAYLYGVKSVGTSAKATGGIITSDANYYYHTFRSSGTFTPTQSLTADYLVVAGGGGGGGGSSTGGVRSGGGGGAGGLRCTVGATGGGGSLESALSLTAQAYTVTIGAGGSGGGTQTQGTSGSNSVFSSITSTGGGGGGAAGGGNGGANGGSGGGGGANNGPAGSGTSNQGYSGAAGFSVNGGGGGGGAGAIGSGSSIPNGGIGIATSINGTSTYYAGGGAGTTGDGATGGLGGGGNSAIGFPSNTPAVAGTANTGGGGGAGTSNYDTGALVASSAGGSGIVIIRYAK